MTNIPKKVQDRFIKAVPKFQKVLGIAKDRDVNESDTVSILQDVLAEVFGFDKYLEVTSEFAIRGTYCDLAIKVDEKVQFLIEAKAIGIDLKENHLRQALNYGANHGLQWVVLTNGIIWNLYRIRFEKPVNYDLVCSFNFLDMSARDKKAQQQLFLLSKEGLGKNIREDFFEKAESVNRHVIGNLILTGPVLNVIRRELRKLADGVKVDVEEVEGIIRNEVLKREVFEGESAKTAQARVKKLAKKNGSSSHKKQAPEPTVTAAVEQQDVSFSDQLLSESEE